MDILPLTEDRRSAWDALCLESPDAWFWHTSGWLDYNVAYRPDLEPRNMSFLLKEGNRILAAVPLLLERHQEHGRAWKKFSFGGGWLPAPILAEGLTEEQRDDLFERVFAVIDDLALELGAVHAAFWVPGLAARQLHPPYSAANPMLRYGYLDVSLATRVIGLRVSEAALWEGLRRNHRRSIEKAADSLRVKIHAAPGVTREKFEEYRRMHSLAAGRVTRPAKTFDLMWGWLSEGKGFLAEALDSSGRGVGYELYMDYRGSVYGMSAANDPDAERARAVRPVIEWEALRWMRSKGFEFYEIGVQQFGALPYDFPDAKSVSIGHFKYGFGGFTAQHFRAERFFSREYWRLAERSRAEAFEKGYEWPAKPGEGGKELLKRMEKARAPDRPEDSEPPPPELAALADALVARNPDAVRAYREGQAKVIHFLVGRAMAEGGGADARLVRRAIEASLAKAAAA